MKFSQRVGARPAPKSGLGEASPPLRTALWNYMYEQLFPYSRDDDQLEELSWRNARAIWAHLNLPVDEAPGSAGTARIELRTDHWFKLEWPEFFDLVEFANEMVLPEYGNDRIRGFEIINVILESNGCAYRFVSEQLAPLTNPEEMGAVAEAAESALPAVSEHIREAIRQLPPGANPSPRNSIKESISAVEAALKHFSGDAAADLTAGLQVFETKFGALHGALRQGLIKLYGYTSDEKGIRHALDDEAREITINDARFMLVTCSAFANYLIALAASAKDVRQ